TEASWESEMDAQRERARAGASFAVGEGADGGAVFAAIPQTFGVQKFLGYQQLTAPARIWAIVREGTAARAREARQGETVEMILDEALETGAMALFGEKYGDRVRVIKIGEFSTELCGGTHLGRTGEIGLLKVTAEGAVASGVRRVEAVAGPAALQSVARSQAALREAADLLKVGPLEVPARVQKLLE